MKIRGKEIKNNNIHFAVIPRSDGEDVVFMAKPVLSFAVFDALCPQPKPPNITVAATKETRPDVTDKKYLAAMQQYLERRTYWLMITSLRDTEGLEWERVDYNNPDTWSEHIKELEEAGFVPKEINEIHGAVTKANALDDDQITAARMRFLASVQQESI